MAVSKDNGRIVPSLKVDLPEHAAQMPWTPAVIVDKPGPPPLPMQLPSVVPAAGPAEKQPMPASDLPAPEPVVRTPIQADDTLEQMVDRHPDAVARAVQTVLIENPAHEGLHLVAELMIGLGTSRAASVLKYCTEDEVAAISRAVAQCPTTTERQKKAVFEAFRQRLLSGEIVLQGGVAFAREMLHKALGRRQGEEVLLRVLPDETSGFRLIQKASAEQLVPYISKEHPQAIALILSQLDAAQAAGVLGRLDRALQGDVMYRIARLETVSPQMMRQLENSLAQDLKALLSGQVTTLGGPKCVAEILNRASRSIEKEVLDAIAKQDPDAAETVRNQMFTFDDIAGLSDRDLTRVLAEVKLEDLAIGLKGAGDRMKQRIFEVVDETYKQDLKTQMQSTGPLRLSDVEGVQLRIVQAVRTLEAQDKITIARGRPEDVYV